MLALALALAARVGADVDAGEWWQQPVVVAFSWSALIGAIWNGLKWLAGKAAEAAVIIAKAVRSAAIFTWKGLGFLAEKAWLGLKWLAGELKNLWSWVKESAWPALVRAFEAVRHWLRLAFAPLYQLVKFLQHGLLWLYDNILRPILNTLEIAQLIAQLLAKLGVEWAGRVAAWLEQLERRIWTAFSAVLARVNAIVSIFGLIFGVDGIPTRTFWYYMVAKYFGDLLPLTAMLLVRTSPYPRAAQLQGAVAAPSLPASWAASSVIARGLDPVSNRLFADVFRPLVRGQTPAV